jgi:hypothetical protein
MQGSSPPQALKRLRQVNHADDPAAVFQASHPVARGQPHQRSNPMHAKGGYQWIHEPFRATPPQVLRRPRISCRANAEGESDW